VQAYESVGSTNDVARGLAVAGGAAGTVVLAEEQVAGRGRVGRGWASPPELGLWFSVIARPAGDPSLLPLRVGLAVAEALDAFLSDAPALLKWPNDLLVGGRKLGGVLCEGSWEAGGRGFVIAGVGLNLLHAASDFPAEIRDRATSLALAADARPDRGAVADAVIPAVIAATAKSGPLSRDRIGRLTARDALRGSEVEVTDPSTGERLAAGTALGIADDGSFLVGGHGSPTRAIRSGTVRPLRAQTHSDSSSE
jgi:BirA family biotin operon repressor/biotin-[acetyl-CoA-carboxylase] ligase